MTDEKIKLILIGGLVAFGTIIASYFTIQAYENYKMQKALEQIGQELQKITEETKVNVAIANERIRLESERRKKLNEEARRQAEAKKVEAEKQRIEREEQTKIEQEKVQKEKSKECQFWRLQKAKETSGRADEKIKEYCGFI